MGPRGLGRTLHFFTLHCIKRRCVVQVFDADGCWMFDVDSHDDRLRRPSGIDVDSAGFVYVADLGNDCIKKFPYI